MDVQPVSITGTRSSTGSHCHAHAKAETGDELDQVLRGEVFNYRSRGAKLKPRCSAQMLRSSDGAGSFSKYG